MKFLPSRSLYFGGKKDNEKLEVKCTVFLSAMEKTEDLKGVRERVMHSQGAEYSRQRDQQVGTP